MNLDSYTSDKEGTRVEYFTSDWHFNHNKPFIYEPRGFSSVYEMNMKIIMRHNEIVTDKDIVYCLGDCCLGGSSNEILYHNKKLIEALNGSLIIIPGNHCTDRRIEMYQRCKNVVCVGSWAMMQRINKHNFYLSHFPTMTYSINAESLKATTLNLFGHTHSKEKFYDDTPFMYNVALDAHDCYPVSVSEIINDMTERMNEWKDMGNEVKA